LNASSINLRATVSGDEVATDEIGEHARVDAVEHPRQRSDRLDLARVGEADVPAHQREPVADPRRAAHHLDAAADLLVAADGQRQPR
jgi:hypothetical protein